MGLFPSEVTVGFESTVYDTTETRGEVRVCAVVFSPTVNSATTTPTGIILSLKFSSGTAGNPIQNHATLQRFSESTMFYHCFSYITVAFIKALI